MSSADDRRGFPSEQLVWTVYVPTFLLAIGVGMYIPALPLYARSLGIAVGLIGLLGASESLGALFGNIPSGLMSARLGGRATMSVGLVLLASGALATGLGGGASRLLFCVPLMGLGGAVLATARLTFVTEATPIEQRGRALAMVGGVNRIGLTIGPVVGGQLTQLYGLEAAFLGLATMSLCALAMLQLRRGDPVVPAPPARGPAHERVLRTVRENRHGLVTSGSVALALVTLRGARGLLLPLWGASLGLGLGDIGLVIGLSYGLETTLFYPVGVVMDRWGRKWTIVPCLLALSVGLALVPLSVGFASFLAVALLGGLGNGLGSGAVMTLGADLAPKERPGEFLGVWRMIADTGGIVSRAMAGGIAQALSLAAAFPVVGAVGLLGAAVMLLAVPDRIRERRLQASGPMPR